MQLDAFQVQDFDSHWGGSYVLIDGKLVYIHHGDRASKQMTVSFITDRGRYGDEMQAPMGAFEIWRPKLGFYNVLTVGHNSPTLMRLSRHPRQSMKRGTDHRNTSLCPITIRDNTSMIEYGRNLFSTSNLISVVNPNYEVEDRAALRASITDPLSDFEGVALSRKIAIARGDNNVPFVLCEGAVVGYVTLNGIIKVFESARCFMDLLNKQDIFPVEAL